MRTYSALMDATLTPTVDLKMLMSILAKRIQKILTHIKPDSFMCVYSTSNTRRMFFVFGLKAQLCRIPKTPVLSAAICLAAFGLFLSKVSFLVVISNHTCAVHRMYD